jgi:hypothetical protein
MAQARSDAAALPLGAGQHIEILEVDAQYWHCLAAGAFAFCGGDTSNLTDRHIQAFRNSYYLQEKGTDGTVVPSRFFHTPEHPTETTTEIFADETTGRTFNMKGVHDYIKEQLESGRKITTNEEAVALYEEAFGKHGITKKEDKKEIAEFEIAALGHDVFYNTVKVNEPNAMAVLLDSGMLELSADRKKLQWTEASKADGSPYRMLYDLLNTVEMPVFGSMRLCSGPYSVPAGGAPENEIVSAILTAAIIDKVVTDPARKKELTFKAVTCILDTVPFRSHDEYQHFANAVSIVATEHDIEDETTLGALKMGYRFTRSADVHEFGQEPPSPEKTNMFLLRGVGIAKETGRFPETRSPATCTGIHATAALSGGRWFFKNIVEPGIPDTKAVFHGPPLRVKGDGTIVIDKAGHGTPALNEAAKRQAKQDWTLASFRQVGAMAVDTLAGTSTKEGERFACELLGATSASESRAILRGSPAIAGEPEAQAMFDILLSPHRKLPNGTNVGFGSDVVAAELLARLGSEKMMELAEGINRATCNAAGFPLPPADRIAALEEYRTTLATELKSALGKPRYDFMQAEMKCLAVAQAVDRGDRALLAHLRPEPEAKAAAGGGARTRKKHHKPSAPPLSAHEAGPRTRRGIARSSMPATGAKRSVLTDFAAEEAAQKEAERLSAMARREAARKSASRAERESVRKATGRSALASAGFASLAPGHSTTPPSGATGRRAHMPAASGHTSAKEHRRNRGTGGKPPSHRVTNARAVSVESLLRAVTSQRGPRR